MTKYVEETRAHKMRHDENTEFKAAAYAWASVVSEDDSLFRFGIDVGGSIPDLFSESGFKVSDDKPLKRMMRSELPEEFGDRLESAWQITTPQKDPVYVYETDNEVWLDVSAMASGTGGGAEVYQMVAGYAYGSGKKFIGDPEGLTDVAMVRRTEAMLSSALRFGTTRHLKPAEQQLTGQDKVGKKVDGVMPLEWSDDDYSNIASLLKVSYNNVLTQMPEIQYVSYDIEQSKFRVDPAAARADGSADRLADYLNAEAGTSGLGYESVFWRRLSPMARALAGSATLKRAVVTQTLLRATGQENFRQDFPGHVRQLFTGSSVTPLTGILYKNDDAEHSSVRVAVVKDWIKPVEEATGVRVQVVATANDLPARIAGQLSSSTTGIYDWATRTPYIIADKVSGEAHAVKTALHEGLGHTGVIEFMRRNAERGGAEMETLLDTIFRDLGASEIRRVVPASYSFDYSIAKDRREAVLEYIAHLAETGAKPKLVNDVAVAGRDFVEGLFGDQRWTRNDILALIETSRAYVLAEQCVKAGAGMDVSPEDRAHRREEAFNKVLADAGGRMEALLKANAGAIAWHGSDAFIKTFDHSLVGTGVGQQNLGYGHYLTTVKPEAERYAEYVGGDRGKVHQVLMPLSDNDFLKLDVMVCQQPESVMNGLAAAGLYDRRLDGLYRNYLSAMEHAAEGGDPDRIAAAEGLNPGDAAKREYETGLLTGADLYARVVESLTHTDEAWNMLPVGAIDSARTVQHAATLLLNKAGIPGAVVAAGKEKIFVIYDETLTPVISVDGQRLHSTSEASFLQAMSAAKEPQLDCPPAVTGTPQFQRWFGESKVVSDSGLPLVLYTGTNQSFDVFNHELATAKDGLVYASNNPKVASEYAIYRSIWKGANVLPVYARAEKLLEVDADYRDIREVELNTILPGMLEGENVKAFAARCLYDGIVYRNARDDVGGPTMTPVSDIYAFFPSAQLKSAIGNNGDFNPEKASILAKIEEENLVDKVNQGDEMSDKVNTVPASELSQAHPDFAQVFGRSVAIDALGSPRQFKIFEHASGDGSIAFVANKELSERDSYLRVENPAFIQKSEPFAPLRSIAEKLGGDLDLVVEMANDFREYVFGYNEEAVIDLLNKYDAEDFGDLIAKKPAIVGNLVCPLAAVFEDSSYVKRFAEAGYDGAIFLSAEGLSDIEYRVFDESQVIPVSEYPAVKEFQNFAGGRHDKKLLWALENDLNVEVTQNAYLLSGGAGSGISVDVETQEMQGYHGLSEPFKFLKVVNVTDVPEQLKQDIRNLQFIANSSREFDVLVVNPETANTLTVGVAKSAGFVNGENGDLIFPVSYKAEKALSSEMTAKPVRPVDSSDRSMQRPAKEVIQRFADEVLEAQGIKEGVNVFVYEMFEDLPDVLKDAAFQRSVNGVVAFGSINLVASEMVSPKTVEDAILKGAASLDLQTNLDIFMERAYQNAWDGFGGKSGVLQAAAEMGHNMAPLASAADYLLEEGQIGDNEYQKMLISEVLACSTMRMNYAKAKPGFKYTVREFMATTRQFCQKTGLRGLPFADASEIALLAWAVNNGSRVQCDGAKVILGSSQQAAQFKWELDVRDLMVRKGISEKDVVLRYKRDDLSTAFAQGKKPITVVNNLPVEVIVPAVSERHLDTDYSPGM